MTSGLVGGAVVPHAPVLVLDTARVDIRDAARRIAKAVRGLETADAEVIVLVSSHGRPPGVYLAGGGGLAPFGVPARAVTLELDAEGARRMSARWREPLVDGALDHGVVVPLLMGVRVDARMIAVALPEANDVGSMTVLLDSARRLASAIDELASSQRVAVVASGHAGAALSPAAPLTDRPEGHALDKAVVDALGGDPGDLCDIPAELWLTGGSCGAGPLFVFGALLRGGGGKIVVHETPAGVGWVVAEA